MAFTRARCRSRGSRCLRSAPAVLMAVLALAGWSARALAQVEIPRRNPKAKVIQHVGLTEVSVEYSSLAVRARSIWGHVVPYDRIWISGETPASKVTFSRPVVVGGTKVPAGSYALLVLPTEGDWTLILNANASLVESSKGYGQELDVARVKVRPETVPHRERLTFLFSDFTDDRARLDLEWERRRVSLPIEVNTREQVLAGISSLDDVWREYADAARYMLEVKKDYGAGLAYAEKSLALRETRYNDWIMASLLAAKGRYAEARDRADRAFRAPPGAVDEAFSEGEIGRAISDWGRAADRTPHAARKESPKLAKVSLPAPGASPVALPVLVLDDERAAPVFSAGGRASAAGSATAFVSPRRSEIAPVVEKGRADVQACYRRAFRDAPVTRGKLMLRISIAPSGLVKSVALNSPREYKVMEPCMKDAVSHWVFPPSVEEYGADVPILLQGKDKE